MHCSALNHGCRLISVAMEFFVEIEWNISSVYEGAFSVLLRKTGRVEFGLLASPSRHRSHPAAPYLLARLGLQERI
ncbi:hypothetical protein I7I50_12685 [Histoplasma capsulatum G186AR]|uniref:Uncharacterized protein n=1 Tax=Ajellomyces capsulatus TaxID=5037 RepID=A0A8H8CRM8_AJECA|nr:hypothetical protein I7I52_11010 [Histoplasma capsulatum]QSS70904.1 hypothetical protein I7I50_12685 [Histoplasma capsulatum G186AR]